MTRKVEEDRYGYMVAVDEYLRELEEGTGHRCRILITCHWQPKTFLVRAQLCEVTGGRLGRVVRQAEGVYPSPLSATLEGCLLRLALFLSREVEEGGPGEA